MKLTAYWRSVYAKFFRREEVADDLEVELRSHVELRADDLERSGMPRAEAERQARMEFGSRERIREEAHAAMGGNFFEVLAQDLRYSVRVLSKSPGFTSVAVLTLALAIGANAVVFGVLNGVVLRKLNLPQPETLYQLMHENGINGGQSYLNLRDLSERNRSFDGIAGIAITAASLDTGHNPSRAWVLEATGNYFDVLRLQPYLGRFFHATDEHGPNSAPYIVLGYAYWRNHFGGDPTVVGREVQINKHPYSIIGVAGKDVNGTLLFFQPDFWVPMVNEEQFEGKSFLNDRSAFWVFQVVGHLKPGVTTAQAVADLNAVGAELGRSYPKETAKLTFELRRPNLYGDFLGRPTKAFLGGLMALAGLILLAACANLGSLFAARAADRSREVALRLALGASRRRVLRQLMTEAVVISMMGGTAGLLASVVLLRWLSAWQPLSRYPLRVPVDPDPKVYLMALVLALLSGLLFGIVPVRQVLRASPYQVVKAGASAMTSSRLTVRDVLLVGQIAICAVLVTSSMVAVRGLVRSLHSNFGFDPHNVLMIETIPAMAGYEPERVPALQKQLIETVQAIPGVEAVGLISRPPMLEDITAMSVYNDQATDLRPANKLASAAAYKVSPDYMRAAGTSLLAGREFTWHDDKDAPAVAVVNRMMARRVFGDEGRAIGNHFKLDNGTRVEVVGLMEDGKYMSLTEDPRLAMLLPILQSPSSQSFLLVRTNREPQRVAPAIDAALRNLDSALPFTIEMWTQSLDGVLLPSRIAAVSLGVLGLLGAMLSITGIFGMAAYSVGRRLRELGIRVALGAQRKQVLWAALGRAVRLLGYGSAAGLVLGLAATRVLAFVVYQATPRDPLVMTGVVIAMALLGLVATWIPARRALSVDPMMLLREE